VFGRAVLVIQQLGFAHHCSKGVFVRLAYTRITCISYTMRLYVYMRIISKLLFSKGTIESQLSASESACLREKKLSATMRVTVGLVGDKLSLWHVSCHFESPRSGLQAIFVLRYLNYIIFILIYSVRVHMLFIRVQFSYLYSYAQPYVFALS
jgi:hypothetical protein